MALDKDRSVYVGGLTLHPDFRQLEKLFGELGKVKEVRVMAHRRDCAWRFAYVTFEKASDATNAVKVMNGFVFQGKTLRVEMYRGWRKSDPSSTTTTGTPAASSMIQLRTPNRIAVSGLPEYTTWQDLKSHFLKVGPVAFADIHIGGTGIVEFQCSSDMHYALKHYDGSKISTSRGATASITVREDGVVHYEQPVPRSSVGRTAGRLRSKVTIRQGTEARSRYFQRLAPASQLQPPYL